MTTLHTVSNVRLDHLSLCFAVIKECGAQSGNTRSFWNIVKSLPCYNCKGFFYMRIAFVYAFRFLTLFSAAFAHVVPLPEGMCAASLERLSPSAQRAKDPGRPPGGVGKAIVFTEAARLQVAREYHIFWHMDTQSIYSSHFIQLETSNYKL